MEEDGLKSIEGICTMFKVHFETRDNVSKLLLKPLCKRICRFIDNMLLILSFGFVFSVDKLK